MYDNMCTLVHNRQLDDKFPVCALLIYEKIMIIYIIETYIIYIIFVW